MDEVHSILRAGPRSGGLVGWLGTPRGQGCWGQQGEDRRNHPEQRFEPWSLNWKMPLNKAATIVTSWIFNEWLQEMSTVQDKAEHLVKLKMDRVTDCAHLLGHFILCNLSYLTHLFCPNCKKSRFQREHYINEILCGTVQILRKTVSSYLYLFIIFIFIYYIHIYLWYSYLSYL